MWWHYEKKCVGLATKAVRDDSVWSGSEPWSSVAMETSSAVWVSEGISVERVLCKSTRDWKGLYKTQMCETAYTEQNHCTTVPRFHQLWPVKEKRQIVWPRGLPHKRSRVRWRWAGNRDDMLGWGLKAWLLNFFFPPNTTVSILGISLSWRNVKAIKYRCPWEAEEHSCLQLLKLSPSLSLTITFPSSLLLLSPSYSSSKFKVEHRCRRRHPWER